MDGVEIQNKKFNIYFPILLIIVSMVMLLFFNLYDYKAIYSILILIIIFPSIYWLYINKSGNINYIFCERNYSIKKLSILFFFFTSLSILSFHFRAESYQRPLLYFIIISILITIIFLEILSIERRKSSIIIFQTILVFLNIVWTQLIIFPMNVGVDPWIHNFFVNSMISSGIITKNNYALFHIFIGNSCLIMNIDYYNSIIYYSSVSLVVCSILFVYLISININKNHRIALASSLVLLFSSHYVKFLSWVIPSTFAIIFLLSIFFLIISVDRKKIKFLSSTLIILFLIVLVLTHPLTTLLGFVFILLITILINNNNFFQTKKINGILIIILTLVMILHYWMNNYIYSIINMLNYKQIASIPNAMNTYIAEIPIYVLFVNSLDVLFFYSLSFLGCFIMYNYNNKNKRFVFIFTIPFIFLLLSQFTPIWLLEDRWWVFSALFLSIPCSLALLSLNSKGKLWHILIILVVSVTAFASVLSSSIDDSSFFPEYKTRTSITSSEFYGISSISTFDIQINVDGYYSIVNFHSTEINVNDVSKDYQFKQFDSDLEGAYIIRQNSANKYIYDPDFVLLNESFIRFYSNGEVRAYCFENTLKI